MKTTRSATRRFHLSGVNGAGKSRLLRCLNGAEPLEAGTVTDLRNPSLRDLPGRVGFLRQDLPRHFFAETVRTEIGFALTARRAAERVGPRACRTRPRCAGGSRSPAGPTAACAWKIGRLHALA
ncbi:ATP-binding cassette domain-containing protein [Azospirillum sp. A26]|uniref:ATP-binding cassette domain-containing protein n=1 Tax=Azospirillum sp. A26 TaxID=3160607 RepID=UPI00366BA92A